MFRSIFGSYASAHGRVSFVVVAILLTTTNIRADIFTGAGFAFNDASKPGSNLIVGESSSNIVISGKGGTVAQINSISLVGLQHSWMGDIVIDLTHVEQNLRVVITAPPPNYASDFGGDYTFAVNLGRPTVDEAAAGLTSSDVLSSGTYEISAFGGGASTPGPRTDFNPFIGAPIDGTWQLRVRDFVVNETGLLGSWSFNTDITAVPEPSSIALFAFALVIPVVCRFQARFTRAPRVITIA